MKHDSCVIQLYGKDGQPVGRQEHPLPSPKTVSGKNEYTLEISLDPRLTFKGGETMYVSLVEPGGAGDTYGPPTMVDISCLLPKEGYLKKLWGHINPYSKWLKWISIILIILSCLVSICYGLYKWRKDVASRTPITEPADTSSVVRAPVLELAPAPTPTNPVVATNPAVQPTPPAVPQPPTASVPTGDDRTVVINHGQIKKLVINNNYSGGHGSSQGARGEQAKPWPYGYSPDARICILEKDCDLPKGSEIRITKVVPAGKDYVFIKPTRWGVRPRVFISSRSEVHGAYNTGSLTQPVWVEWSEVQEWTESSEFRFKARERDITITFILTAL